MEVDLPSWVRSLSGRPLSLKSRQSGQGFLAASGIPRRGKGTRWKPRCLPLRCSTEQELLSDGVPPCVLTSKGTQLCVKLASQDPAQGPLLMGLTLV